MGFKEWATRSKDERAQERADLKVKWAANKAKFAADRERFAVEREGHKTERVTAKVKAAQVTESVKTKAPVAKAKRAQTRTALATSHTDESSPWDDWEPGNTSAAELLSHGGLAKLLARTNETIDGITGPTLDQLGNLLAEGVAKGAGVDSIARTLRDIVDDPDRAYNIANTEIARATSRAAMNGYHASGMKEVDWLASPGACPKCASYGANGPYVLDDAPTQPAHASCRCAYGPRDPGM
jgi:hypothetical protein